MSDRDNFITSQNIENEYNNLIESEYNDLLKEGAKQFELFMLRPKRYNNQKVMLRLRINKKWSGWKLKDQLIRSLHLEVGDTISTEVTPYFTNNILEQIDDTDLFASGDCADWILDNNVNIGTIIDCEVRFVYTKAPIGPDNKTIYLASLIVEKCLTVVGVDEDYKPQNDMSLIVDKLLQTLID